MLFFLKALGAIVPWCHRGAIVHHNVPHDVYHNVYQAITAARKELVRLWLAMTVFAKTSAKVFAKICAKIVADVVTNTCANKTYYSRNDATGTNRTEVLLALFQDDVTYIHKYIKYINT